MTTPREHISEADDLSNLEEYGEPESLGLLYDARQKFQVSNAGRDYQLHITPANKQNMADCINWIKRHVPPAARFNPGMKDALQWGAGEDVPLVFEDGVWIEFQCNILGVDNGMYVRVVDFKHWMECLDDMLKTSEAHWIKAARGDSHKELVQASEPQPAKVTGVKPKLDEIPGIQKGMPPAFKGKTADEIDFGISEEYGAPIKGEKSRLIVAMNIIEEISKKDEPYKKWLLYFWDDKQLKVQGKKGTITWGDFADQIRAIVPDEHRPDEPSLSPMELPKEYRFRAFYTTPPNSSGIGTHTKFHRAEAQNG